MYRVRYKVVSCALGGNYYDNALNAGNESKYFTSSVLWRDVLT